jgi:hypothetical protein
MFSLGYIGPVTLGDTVRLAIQCYPASFVATAPDAAPSWAIYKMTEGSETSILTGTLGAADADSKTGFRTGDAVITAGNGFASGNVYIVRFAYAITSAFVQTATFIVE